MARSNSTTPPSPRRSKKPATPPPSPPTWDELLINKLAPYRVELAGIVLFLIAALTLLALPGLTRSGWLGWWTSLLRQVFGWGAYPLSLSVAAGGLHVALRRVPRPYHIRPSQIIGFELILLTTLPLSHQLSGATLADAYLGRGGGLVGWALSAPLQAFLGPLLAGLLMVSLFVWGLALIIGLQWTDLLRGLRALSARLHAWGLEIAPDPPTAVLSPRAHPAIPQPIVIAAADLPDDAPEPGRRDPRLPPLTCLEAGSSLPVDDQEVLYKKAVIEHTLADFGIPAEVVQIRRGPAVTQFGVRPGYIERTTSEGAIHQQKVRIGQIVSLRRDLALALAAPRLRIQAPVPGRGVVGIEVPNGAVSLVRLRDVIASPEFQARQAPLTVALGRDVSGTAVAVDLAKLPHLLIAGTTGSGKSICLNAFIACLVFNNPPEELQLIMIDPKKVELMRFNGLPHLIGKVEVEADRAVGVLRWLTAEMDRRYELFAQVGARNLGGYNRRARRRGSDVKPLPHIVIVIDELADLMHMYPGDVERTLCRLAQMARATGIHLVVATQRPSTDVITGLIKANFPARLSFAVASNIDSRVILDAIGAEQLLGKGDMLFLGPDASGPLRVQGVFISDEEIVSLVRHWQQAMPDFTPTDPPWETLIARFALLDETDSLLEAAIELAQKYDQISASFLQRRLRLGYPRAARIMEHLYEMGLVEDPKAGGRTRKTLVDEDDDPLETFLSEQS